ncbi:hypothetical protein COW36_20495 [bacterium (Candidatus Blackallbacteria) CG17_big_fil_post_rev_8_21_14_2_50_48_46]|uniref:Peptidase S74 domain-containing protein n=1 Tax=bacterium (Candidatus Blackallbacteria) CG17_big_fil_post_rev_8_21_14_2_50_48_46 TaxID=2014261 RepID=A0A2M7FZT0_9BACT|nr:MAG: hypothetical protein COW64_22820 [bacterium (Candidatus Blackallbacteria) CG18_big_fil_WC_8_21_14_2_50_49_26]PIW14785.1 MAG: hypothetical protein COW36_20495 [bacterium (Candidatus Blackallbacteria) CG17_big_fil_post_rev_8_21_14_2_50_48_46]PIW50887.1 MAG: hypothetical protein COW20_01310 [bacterium (Candidatus Blackallbacteria) CG13_big_fil_rev_8_21_14_2_50_49_14]
MCISLLFTACQVNHSQQTQPSPSTGELKWYTTCGAPVCGAPNSTPGANTCGDKQEGMACSQAGASCDLGNDCQQKLVCASSDPKLQPGGCPISKAEFKHKIETVTPAARARLAQKLQNLPLVTWQYRFEPQGPQRLGFMINKHTPQELVKPDGNSVDLYGYLSLAVAALQEQQSQIQTLENRIQTLEKQLNPPK